MVTMLTNLQGNVIYPEGNHSTYGGLERGKRRSYREQPGYRAGGIDAHFVRSFTEVSRTLIAQSSVDVEDVVRNILMKAVALVVDKAILTG